MLDLKIIFEVLAIANEEGRDAISWPFSSHFHATRSRSLALSAIMKVVYVTLWSEIDGKLHALSKLIGGATYPDESD